MSHTPLRIVLGLLLAALLVLGGCNSDEGVTPAGPMLSLSSKSLIFTATAGGTNPPSQRVTVSNSGIGELTFTVTKTADWVNILPRTGDFIYVEIFITGLTVGEHFDTLVVSSPEALNSPKRIAVKLTINPGFSVAPLNLSFTALRNGANPPTQPVVITSQGGSTVDYTITKLHNWITLSTATGSATDTVDVGASSSILPSGVYTDSLTITSTQATGHATVACALMVKSWDLQELGGSYDLRDMDFVDDQHGWITGFIGNNPGHVGVVLRTEDGGASWLGVHSENNTNMGGIDMLNLNQGWAVGDSAVLLKTANGVTWVRVTSLPITSAVNLWRVHFVSELRGWAIGTTGVILYTNDGGDTWVTQNSTVTVSLANMFFVDENEGWIVGNNGKILHTTQAGQTWTPQASGTISDLWGIHFADKNNGWVVGRDGLVLRTTNGGQSWDDSHPGPAVQYQQIFFTDDALHGWIVGQQGVILYTSNGGGTWTQQLTGIENWLFDVLFLDTDRGFVVGEEGVVLKTLGGGI